MCKVYSVCNQKGGCGKSNVSVNLAAALAKEGKRVLVVDADPQGSGTVSLGFENPDDMDYTLAEIMKEFIDSIRDRYETVLIDCMPSLGIMTINALVAADSVIIPTSTAYLPVKGLQQLLSTISKVRKQLNKDLRIEGILLTMVDLRTVYARDMLNAVLKIYGTGSGVGVFESFIPYSVRAAESSAAGVSIFRHDPDVKVAAAYMDFGKELMGHEAETR